MKGKILEGKLLIERDEQETEVKTASGIILPNEEKKVPTRGKVVMVGSGTLSQVGDVVYWGRFAGTEFKLNGSDYLLLSESDVLFIEG